MLQHVADVATHISALNYVHDAANENSKYCLI